MGMNTFYDQLLNLGVMLLLFFLVICALIYYGVNMPGESYKGKLPALDAEMRSGRDRLSDHVHALAEEIGERHYQKQESLDKAAY